MTRSVPAEVVIERLAQEIAALTKRLVVAEALLAAAEAELAERPVADAVR